MMLSINNTKHLEWRQQPRVSTCYHQIPDTFRLSSKCILARKDNNTLLGKWGDNLQNKNKDIRRFYVADYGKKLGQIDQAGAEALVVAYDCKATSKYRMLFNNGIKPHVYCAGKLFMDRWKKDYPDAEEILNLPISQIKLHPNWLRLKNAIANSDNEPMRYYYIGKKTIHAGNYGEREKTFVDSVLEETDGAVRLTLNQGKDFLFILHSTFPEIKGDFQNGIINEASSNRMVVRNLFGDPREFGGIWGDDTWRKMYAFRPQSTVGTITNLAITEIQEDIFNDKIPHKDWGLDILQNGHDSILFQCYIGAEHEVISYIKPKIERKLVNRSGEVFYMKSETGVGFNWKAYHAIKNPLGLQEYFAE